MRHAGKWDAYMKKRGGREAILNSKVTYINGQVASGDKVFKKYFSDSLLQNIPAVVDIIRELHLLFPQSSFLIVTHNEMFNFVNRVVEL